MIAVISIHPDESCHDVKEESLQDNSSNQEDCDLIRAIAEKKGEEESAHDKLYLKYYKSIIAFLIKSFNFRREIAEELYQDMMLRVWEKADSFQGGNAKAWLFTIARNIALNYIRKIKSWWKITDSINTTEGLLSVLESRTDPASDSEKHGTIEAFFLSLSQTEKEFFALWQAGFSQAEIQEFLGWTVKIRKVRGKVFEKFRKHFG